jgi:hypothetical protein
MSTSKPPLIQLHLKIDRGVKQATREAVEKHRRLGQSIAVWQNGEVVILTPDQIPPLLPNND